MTDYSALFTGKTATPQAPATHLTPPKYRLLIVDDEVEIRELLAQGEAAKAERRSASSRR